MKFARVLLPALLLLPAATAVADDGACVVSPEICDRISGAYRRLEEDLGQGERAIRDLVSPVLPSCTADVSGFTARSSYVVYVSTESDVQLTKYGVRGENSGTCPAEYHEPPSSPEGMAICNVFLLGNVGYAAGSDSDVDGNCLASATSFDVPFSAVFTVEGYTFGDSGVLPAHDLATYRVYCAPGECVQT